MSPDQTFEKHVCIIHMVEWSDEESESEFLEQNFKLHQDLPLLIMIRTCLYVFTMIVTRKNNHVGFTWFNVAKEEMLLVLLLCTLTTVHSSLPLMCAFQFHFHCSFCDTSGFHDWNQMWHIVHLLHESSIMWCCAGFINHPHLINCRVSCRGRNTAETTAIHWATCLV